MSDNTNRVRILVASLTLSAAGLVGIVTDESYNEQAVIPTKNDRPTVGFGSTFHADGTPVRMGERTTPPKALVMTMAHISKEETVFRNSLAGASLSQPEFDVYMDWTYQFGTGAWINSRMRREVLAGNYAQACESLLLYKRSGGYDCSIPGNRICAGVWTRQLKRHAKCMGAQ